MAIDLKAPLGCLGALVLLGLSGCTGNSPTSPATPTSSASSSPSAVATGTTPTQSGSGTPAAPSPVATTVPPAAAGEQLTRSWAETQAAEGTQALEAIATGAVLEEARNQAQEFEAEQWRVEGRPQVTSVAVLEENLQASPPSFTVRVCVDSSGVQVFDDADKPLRATKKLKPTLVDYVVIAVEGRWMLSDMSSPSSADC